MLMGLLNSVAQALRRHSLISSFRTPSGKRHIVVIVIVVVGPPPRLVNKLIDFRALTPQRYTKIFVVGPLPVLVFSHNIYVDGSP